MQCLRWVADSHVPIAASSLVGADPDVGPCRRDRERANALERGAIAHHLALGADVAETATTAPPMQADLVLCDVAQARAPRRTLGIEARIGLELEDLGHLEVHRTIGLASHDRQYCERRTNDGWGDR